MRNIKQIERRKKRGNVAVFVALLLCATGATANESGAVWAIESQVAARNEKEDAGFWPRLGSKSVPTTTFNGNSGSANASNFNAQTGGATAGQNRVETANFIGYSGSFEESERDGGINGRTRLVDWTASDALLLNPARSLDASPLDASAGETGETTKNDKDGQSAAPLKTPIQRDEPVAATRGGGSFGSALVSTFGALAVVLGAFFALVAFLKRTGARNGGSDGALEIVDSLAVGDKARLLTIRWGNRLILAAKTPENFARLAEIADTDEASALLAEIERRKETGATGDVGAKAAAIWKRGRDAASVWRTTVGTKGRRQ